MDAPKKPTLKQLAQTANRCHKTSEANAAKAGAALIEAKERVEHGEWLTWLHENCPDIPERRAQHYMSLARGDADRPGRPQKAKGQKAARLPDNVRPLRPKNGSEPDLPATTNGRTPRCPTCGQQTTRAVLKEAEKRTRLKKAKKARKPATVASGDPF
ncbi:MAG: DUF3102 domain-containing protein [Solirubrobacterales bacterium]